MTEKTFRAGERVERDHSQATTTGEIVCKLTRSIIIKAHKVAASTDNAEYQG